MPWYLCWQKMMFDEILTIAKNNPSAVILVVSATIAWMSFNTQRFLARAKNTIDFEASYHNSKEVQDCENRVRNNIRFKLTSNEIADIAKPEHFSTEFSSDIRETLNVWERVAIAVKNKVYDEDILYMAYGSSLTGLWKDLRPYIKAKQEKNPRLYINLDWLAIRWLVKRDDPCHKQFLEKLRILSKYS